MGDDRREIRKAYFENLRIPLDNAEILQQLATLADEIIAAKKTGKDTAELENRVNEIVYQLYGINDSAEIEAVEKRWNAVLGPILEQEMTSWVFLTIILKIRMFHQ